MLRRDGGRGLHRVDTSFWAYVENMDDRSMRCKFCGHLFSEGTLITRIRFHLAGVTGRGVRSCGQVPQHVRDAALAASEGPPAKKGTVKALIREKTEPAASEGPSAKKGPVKALIREKTEPAASEGPLAKKGMVKALIREKTEPVASMLEQSRAILNKLAVGDDGRIQVGVQAMEQGEGFIQHVDRNVCPERARLMENSSGRLVQPSTSASSTKLVGRAFEQNMKVIRSWLMDDEVSTIGIYGMGGVGKTTMLQHICNELLGRPGISQDVCWVTISQDFNIKKLHNLIAKCLDLDISSEDDDMSKTVKLAKELAKKQKWILIIDDLWNSFKPQEVGIPIPLKGSKLIMTTRSEMVCRQMNSQNNIRVDPLSDEESWTLFMEKLGQDKPLSPEVEQIAVDVARECAGLPLGIVTLAESLKGVDDLHEWRITLKRLRESNFWDMEDQIFQILRSSYDCLDDSARQCFVYCALFDERQNIERGELIESFIEEGIIKKMNSQAAVDKCHSILDRLEDVCLLKRIDGGSAVKMHDLLRDMAIQILDEDEYSLVMG